MSVHFIGPVLPHEYRELIPGVLWTANGRSLYVCFLEKGCGIALIGDGHRLLLSNSLRKKETLLDDETFPLLSRLCLWKETHEKPVHLIASFSRGFLNMTLSFGPKRSLSTISMSISHIIGAYFPSPRRELLPPEEFFDLEQPLIPAGIVKHTFSITDDAALRREHDQRTPSMRFLHLVISIIREVRCEMDLIRRAAFSSFSWHSCQDEISWKENSEGLIVFVHGIHGHPCIWDTHRSCLPKDTKIDIFVPFVPEKGNCTLEKAAIPILAFLVNYAKTHPKKPLSLIGFSNGSRLVLWLEWQMRKKAPDSPIRIETIAGVHFGSSLANYLEQSRVAGYLAKSVVYQELRHGSETAQKLLLAVALPTSSIRAYAFHGSTGDFLVPHLGSSLPALNKEEQIHVWHGFIHAALVDAIAKEQMQNCLTWMASFVPILPPTVDPSQTLP